MPDYTPLYSPADTFTRVVVAGNSVIGGRLVQASTTPGSVFHALADSINTIGVAAFDAAAGQNVAVHRLSGMVHTLTASAPIASGGLVKAAANGLVAPYVPGTDAGDRLIGVALTAAAAANDPVQVLGR